MDACDRCVFVYLYCERVGDKRECVCVCVCVCVHTHTSVYICVYECMWEIDGVCVCVHLFLRLHVNISVYANMCVRL